MSLPNMSFMTATSTPLALIFPKETSEANADVASKTPVAVLMLKAARFCFMSLARAAKLEVKVT